MKMRQSLVVKTSSLGTLKFNQQAFTTKLSVQRY
jgi:hypothetical protein